MLNYNTVCCVLFDVCINSYFMCLYIYICSIMYGMLNNIFSVLLLQALLVEVNSSSLVIHVDFIMYISLPLTTMYMYINNAHSF